MIEIEITSRLQTEDFPWAEVMQGVSEAMLVKIKQNFLDGGRPDPWTPKADGTSSHLIKTGALFNGLQNDWGEDYSRVSTTGGLPYASMHQYGGVIDHPGSEKLQAFTVAGEDVFTHKTRPHQITIPPRPYMVLTDQDIEEIVTYLEGQVVDHFNHGLGGQQ